MYIGTLTLALVLAVFGAVLLAALLGNQLARPLLLLAEGVRQVAHGDLSAKPVFASRDELGGLTRSFADMTEQLADARALVQRSVRAGRGRARQPADHPRQPDRRRDRVRPRGPHRHRQPRRHAHPASCRCRPTAAAGSTRCRAWRPSPRRVWQRFELHATSPEAGERDHWQDAFELQTRPAGPRPRHADAAGARRRDAAGRAADGLRRHHRGRLGAARRGLERGGAAPRARDQEPADADPALGRAPAAQARGQARGRRPGDAARARSAPSSTRCRR